MAELEVEKEEWNEWIELGVTKYFIKLIKNGYESNLLSHLSDGDPYRSAVSKGVTKAYLEILDMLKEVKS